MVPVERLDLCSSSTSARITATSFSMAAFSRRIFLASTSIALVNVSTFLDSNWIREEPHRLENSFSAIDTWSCHTFMVESLSLISWSFSWQALLRDMTSLCNTSYNALETMSVSVSSGGFVSASEVAAQRAPKREGVLKLSSTILRRRRNFS